MHQFIEDVIGKFGGRLAGSPAEKDAQLYAADVMEGFCTKTLVHRFLSPLDSMHHSLRLFCSVYFIALVLYWHCPIGAFLLAAANAVFYVGHFVLYRYWLDPIFAKTPSSNVIGIIEPKGEVRGTLILAGHMDSTTEYRFWFWLKELGLGLTIAAGFLPVLLPLFYGVDLIWRFLGHGPMLGGWVWNVFFGLTPLTALLWFMRSDRVVDGAQDNLSGVAVSLGAGRVLAGADPEADLVPGEKLATAPKLEHVRVMVASFGAEEAGLRGSEAFARDFSDILRRDNAVLVNFDGILHKRHLHIVAREISPGVKSTPRVVHRLQHAFRDLGLFPGKGVVPFGATDSASFLMRGLPAASILGLSTEKLDPTYHTRLDMARFVEPEALEAARDVAVNFALDWDEELKKQED